MKYPAHAHAVIWNMNPSGELKWICNKLSYYTAALVGAFLNRGLDGDKRKTVYLLITERSWDR